MANEDTVQGTGEDTVVAGTGDDTVVAGTGTEELQGDDTVVADNGEETVDAGAGDDTVDGAGEFNIDEWGGPTGDQTGDDVLAKLHESGLDADSAKALLYDAVKAGDPSQIDKEALIEKVGKVNANLIMNGVEAVVSRNNAKVEAAMKIVHETAGSKEAWETMLPWIKNNVSKEDIDEFTPMINAGGKQAAFAVAELKAQYNADPKNTRIDGKTLEGDTKPAKVIKGISQREYGDQLSKLARTGKATPEARAALLKRRRLGEQQGI
ncbi:head scaffolding protein [Phage MedPE-SWcel-C56]|uniref:Scaffolding protein n=1 Tax=Phage MedPE-SWcel-C56 TaxID=1871314 RepID=A0A1B1IY28_9CAUD|nr:head scaffolding protein [Phage MedPE-SWcel-C56]ANS06231.1 hypothetical protein [Phage MedPE-SWcel-C56]